MLLGGEPTVLPKETLINIANIIHKYNYDAIMSTNGVEKDKIIELLPYYDWIQVICYNDNQIEFFRKHKNKINIKICGDKTFTFEKLNHLVEFTSDFERVSVSMYFDKDYNELCVDKRVWDILDTLNWVRNGAYYYAFYKHIRFKKCVKNETNIIDEPTIPKLYPNGNYNKNWDNEDLDDYLTNNMWNS